MKNGIIITLLVVSWLQVLSAQETNTLTCSNSQDKFLAIKEPGSPIVLIHVNTLKQQLDTILISYTGLKVLDCRCNDSIVTFMIDGGNRPYLEFIKKERDQWDLVQQAVYLPAGFPMIGCLTKGVQYESNSCKLVSVDKVTCSQTIYRAGDRGLSIEQEFEIEYHVKIPDRGNNVGYPDINTSQNLFLEVVKKTPKAKN